MNRHTFKLTLLALGLSGAIVPSAWACVAKSGKLCPSTVAHQVDNRVKLGKPLPTGNVGDATPVGGVVPLGAVMVQPAPSTAGPAVQDSPDGWFYLPHSADLTRNPSGLGSRPITYAWMLMIQARAAQLPGYKGPNVNPDGSLTPHGVQQGWVRLQAVNIPQQVVQAVPPALQVVAPALAPTPANAPGLAGQGPVPTAGQITAPQPIPGQTNVPGYAAPGKVPTALHAAVPNQLAGHAANGAAHAHEMQLVEVYHPTKASLHGYGESHLAGDSDFHLVIIGFKEPQ